VLFIVNQRHRENLHPETSGIIDHRNVLSIVYRIISDSTATIDAKINASRAMESAEHNLRFSRFDFLKI